MQSAKKTDRSLKLIIGIVLYVAALITQAVPLAHAAPYVQDRFDQLSDSAPSAVTNHRIGFTFTDLASPVGSLRFEFCSNDALPETACTTPAGFDASGVVLQTQSGETGFTLHPSSDANNIILSRVPAPPTSPQSVYEFNTVVSPNSEGTYFVRIHTFASDDATGPVVEVGGIALSVDLPFSVSTEVPPYLKFCAAVSLTDFDCSSATTFFIDLGEFSSSQTTTAVSQMIAATNAEFGYSISLGGTTLTSGNNVIPALASQPSSPGTSQFGINLRANSSPSVGADAVGPGSAAVSTDYNVPNQFRFVSGESIAGGPVAQDNKRYTVSYITNISAAQAAGVYATTISYICLANF